MAIAPATIAQDGTRDIHWVGTWTASPQAASKPVEFKGQTIRQIVRVSIGGKRVRVRLSNAFGASPLVIGAAHVALRSTGATIAQDRPDTDIRRVAVHEDSARRSGSQRPVNLQVPDPASRRSYLRPGNHSRRPSIRRVCRRPISLKGFQWS
jgi:hypothetical protein